MMYKKEIEEARNNVLNAVQQAKDVIINSLKSSNNNSISFINRSPYLYVWNEHEGVINEIPIDRIELSDNQEDVIFYTSDSEHPIRTSIEPKYEINPVFIDFTLISIIREL